MQTVLPHANFFNAIFNLIYSHDLLYGHTGYFRREIDTTNKDQTRTRLFALYLVLMP